LQYRKDYEKLLEEKMKEAKEKEEADN